MELRAYTAADLRLTEALEGDPEVMKDLGGARSLEKIRLTHEKRASFVASGGWWFKIVPDAAAGPVGTIGIWPLEDAEWAGEGVGEMGWMILPAFHGRGLASEAARLILDRARAEKKYSSVHAFPGIANGASNAICRKAGFLRLEERDVDYDGRILRCNHWRIDLA